MTIIAGNSWLEIIAKVCHQANKAYCEGVGDFSQKDWDDAEQWQRDSAIKGVTFKYQNPNAPASAQHDAWLADKKSDGWKYGAVKDATKKEHPCLVPYEDLPQEQKIKDYIFTNICDGFMEAGISQECLQRIV